LEEKIFPKKRVAVVGAGISGVLLARKLAERHDVVVFEKSRGVGGRMSTRKQEGFHFDHGAPFFTARTHEFQNFLAPHFQSGLIQPWVGKITRLSAKQKETSHIWFEPHYVACPSMNILCKTLAEELNLQLNVEVAPLEPLFNGPRKLKNTRGDDLGSFDCVVSTAPLAQSQKLFQLLPVSFAQDSFLKLEACFSLMLGYNKPWHKAWIAAKVLEGPLDWIFVNSTKPGRDNSNTALVVQSSLDWAQKYVELDVAEVQKHLFAEFTGLLPELSSPDFITTHRWRYARGAAKPATVVGFRSDEQCVAALGDWCQEGNVESAFFAAKHFLDSGFV
jgi:renalase